MKFVKNMSSKKSRSCIFAVGCLAILFWLPYLVLMGWYSDRVHRPQAVTATADQSVIVFGARVYPPKTPSPILKQRILAAAAVNGDHSSYFVSGTGGENHEDKVMAQELQEMGVQKKHISLDPYGIDTGDTCRHAAQQGIKSAIIVTQFFHLTRTLWVCEMNGMEVTGVDASTIPVGLKLDQTALISTYWIRLNRHAREAGLVWLHLVGLYDIISDEAPY